MTGRRSIVAVAAGAFAVFSSRALAQAAGSAAAPIAPVSPAGSLVQSVVGLVLVVALIYGAAWVMKRVGPRGRGNGLVQVLGGASVGPRERVVVVRYAGETLLLGVAPGQVSLLRASPDTDGPPVESGETAQPSFVERLRAARSGR